VAVEAASDDDGGVLALEWAPGYSLEVAIEAGSRCRRHHSFHLRSGCHFHRRLLETTAVGLVTPLLRARLLSSTVATGFGCCLPTDAHYSGLLIKLLSFFLIPSILCDIKSKLFKITYRHN
jgi:hypothetical protein